LAQGQPLPHFSVFQGRIGDDHARQPFAVRRLFLASARAYHGSRENPIALMRTLLGAVL